MLGINLPGSKKVKGIILLILVVLAMWIIGNEIVNNKQSQQNQVKKEDKKTIVSGETHIIAPDKQENEEDDKEASMYNEAYGIFHQGEYQKSIDIANQIIEQYPDSYKAYSIRGIAKAYNGQYSEGMSDIDKALQLKADYGYGIFNKALCYELYGYYDDALKWYDEALKVEEYVWTYYGIASIYGRRGDAANTALFLQKAIDIAKTDDEKQNIKDEAKKEQDFDNVREDMKFINVIK